jgi:HAE1 family hydrophobic/amphiphilic exporter-1
VIAVSIPLSIFAALALMKWLPSTMHEVLLPVADGSPFFSFLLRLAPKELTLNIMTLSGLTVAVGRVVDDSIVVLENIFRQIQLGNMTKREAILTGTRDVSVAIFAATGITVVVFLPLGLTGGLIGEFFLPFGLAVTYALLASFVVAITVIPVLVEMFVTEEEAHEEPEGGIQHFYVGVLQWVLSSTGSKFVVVVLAIASAAVGALLFGTRPQAFIPEFGDPQISVAIELPAGTSILETDEISRQAEDIIRETVDEEQLETVSTIVGGGGLSLASLTGGNSISENRATITIGVESSEELDANTLAIRQALEAVFGNEIVTISKATLTSQGGFGGFELVMSGNDQSQLFALEPCIVEILNKVEGIANVSSNLAQTGLGGGKCVEGGAATSTESTDSEASGSAVYLRINQQPALNFTGQVETEDTINLAGRAIKAIEERLDLPEGVTIGQGYNSQFQQEGFSGIFVAMGIAIVIVVLILIVVFGSPVYWFAVIFSIAVAPVGAAIALTVTSLTLGISALIGLLMLLGLVVTNAVVLIDRVSSNRHERKMPVKEALLEAGGRRLRPILMTALATIFALMPLALGLSEGALIAEELGTVVIGGLLSSTLLTLVVVPAVYSLTSPLHNFFIRRDRATADAPSQPTDTDEKLKA